MKLHLLVLDRDDLLKLIGTTVFLEINGFEAWILFNILQLIIKEKGDISIKPVLQEIARMLQAQITVTPSILEKVRKGWEEILVTTTD